MDILREYVTSSDDETQALLFDGFPKTKEQLELFNQEVYD